MYQKIGIAILLVCVLALTGCMKTGTNVAGTVMPTIAALASPAAVGSLTPQAATVELPKQLEDLESNAEDVMDDIDGNDWTKASEKVKAMQQDMTDLQPSFQSVGVQAPLISEVNSAIANLAQQVDAKSAYDAKVQANAVTKSIPDIYDYYKVTIPTDLGRLDYLGREIALNAEKNDWSSAATNSSELETVWTRLKANLNATAQKSAAEFEASVNALVGDVTSQNADRTIKDATSMLDKVDVLEKAYT